MIEWQQVIDAAGNTRAWVSNTDSQSNDEVKLDLVELCRQFWLRLAPAYTKTWNCIFCLMQIDEGQIALCGAVDFDLHRMLPGCSLTFIQVRRQLQVDALSMDEYVALVRAERLRFASLLDDAMKIAVRSLPEDFLLRGRSFALRAIYSPEPEQEFLLAMDVSV